MVKKFYLTKEGLKKLEQDLEKLKALRGSKLEKDVPAPFYSEELNTEFVAFKEDLEYLDGKIEEIGYIVKNYQIIKPPLKQEQDKVNLGATITVDIKGQKESFKMVGTLEANPSLGMVSNESPVGQALMGHRAGDEVVIESPDKPKYKIKKIAY